MTVLPHCCTGKLSECTGVSSVCRIRVSAQHTCFCFLRKQSNIFSCVRHVARIKNVVDILVACLGLQCSVNRVLFLLVVFQDSERCQGVELFLANCAHDPKRTGGAGHVFWQFPSLMERQALCSASFMLKQTCHFPACSNSLKLNPWACPLLFG
jgi:hypothetical protein